MRAPDIDIRKKLLIIDDESTVRHFMQEVLCNDYEVSVAESVDEGMQYLLSESPDLILMDVVLPDKDGFEGLKEAREVDPEVSIVMMSGSAPSRAQTGSGSFDSMMMKPFRVDELYEHVNAALAS